jgi:hypothetical protein
MERRTDPIGHDRQSGDRYAFLKISNALQKEVPLAPLFFCFVQRIPAFSDGVPLKSKTH